MKLNINIMRTILILILCILFAKLNAQLQVNTNYTPQQLVSQFLAGTGVNISNVSYSGNNSCIGYFSNGQTTNLGLSNGIIMSTGGVINVPNPGSYFLSNNMGGAGDPLLAQIGGGSSNDAVVLTFTLVSQFPHVQLQYVFASEEYPEYVCSGYNDVFGIFVTGPNPNGGNYDNDNIALIPNTNMPVAINSVNPGMPGSYGNSSNCASLNYSQYYVDNSNGATLCFDGFTTVFKASFNVIPNQPYQIKIAISDIIDGIYDSGLFLKANSLYSLLDNHFCSTAQQLCLDSSFAFSLFNNTFAESGPDYGCLVTQPNPHWFIMQPIQSGDLQLSISSNNDYIAWGPFNSLSNVCSQLTSSAIIGCSYSPGIEVINISNALAGNYYVLLITNYSNVQGSATIVQSNANQPGAGSLSCNILSCSIDSVSLQVASTCDSLNRFNVQGTAWFSNVSPTSSVKIKDLITQVEQIVPVGGSDSVNFSLMIPQHQGQSKLIVQIINTGCTDTIIYTKPQTPTISINVGNSSCGQTNGYIIAGVTQNGIPNYSYLWSTGQQNLNTSSTMSFLNSIPAGMYSVTVYNANQCYSTSQVEISDNGAPQITLQADTNVCENHCSASIVATANSQHYPLTYSWSNGYVFTDSTGIGSAVHNLCNGQYTVTVTDSAGCSSIASQFIFSSSDLQASIGNLIHPTCQNLLNGSISVSASGGVQPYSYTWSTNPVQHTATVYNLAQGIYYCTITDQNGCTKLLQATLTNVSNLTASLNLIALPSCAGYADGCLEVIASNGVLPYTYQWSNGQSGQINCMLGAGNHWVTVTDNVQCHKILSFPMPDGPQPHVGFTYVQDMNIVSFNNTSSSGNYLWTFGDNTSSTETNPIHIYQDVGTYQVCLTLFSCDTLINCQNVQITQLNHSINEQYVISVFPNPVKEQLYIETTVKGVLSVQISDIASRTLFESKLSSSGQIDFTGFSSGCYWITIFSDQQIVYRKLIVKQ